MSRPLDREILVWGRKTVRDQLNLLWEEVDRNGVKVIACWEDDPWSSQFVISASQARRPKPGRWWAVCFADFGPVEPVQAVLSDDREAEIPPPPLTDARDIRRILEVPGVEDRPELCQLLVTLGFRRDEIDLSALRRFAKHEDRVVRYTALGILSWQPSVTNAELLGKFGDDPDPKVRDLAGQLSSGRTRRKTRYRR